MKIHRVSPGEFRVEENYAGGRTDLGPMTEVQMEAYLGNRTLIDTTPAQILQGLEGTPNVSVLRVVSIVRPAVAIASS